MVKLLKPVQVRMTETIDEACSKADIIIITTPSHVRESLLQRMAPILPKHKTSLWAPFPVLLALTGWLKNVRRCTQYCYMGNEKMFPILHLESATGKKCQNGGGKSQLYVAVHGRENHQYANLLLNYLKQLFMTHLLRYWTDYLEITLTPGNPLCTALLSMALSVHGDSGNNRPFESIPCWWNDCPELGAYFLARCDRENQALCNKSRNCIGINLSSKSATITAGNSSRICGLNC